MEKALKYSEFDLVDILDKLADNIYEHESKTKGQRYMNGLMKKLIKDTGIGSESMKEKEYVRAELIGVHDGLLGGKIIKTERFPRWNSGTIITVEVEKKEPRYEVRKGDGWYGIDDKEKNTCFANDRIIFIEESKDFDAKKTAEKICKELNKGCLN